MNDTTIDFHEQARAQFDEASAETRAGALPILRFVSKGFRVSWFKEKGRLLWIAVLKPRAEVAAQFGLRYEVLLLGNSFQRDFHQRTLAFVPPADIADRLDPAVRFVFSDVPVAEAYCAAWAQKHRASVVLIRSPDSGSDSDALYSLLSTNLWRRDFFAESEPVRAASEFFGRQADVNELLAKIMAGSPVGVLGLRKIGKSSLLGRVEDLLRSQQDSVSATVQVRGNAAKFKSGRWWHLAEAMLRGWIDSLSEKATATSSPVRPKAEALARQQQQRPNDQQALAVAFERDCRGLLKAARAIAAAGGSDEARLVAFVDEYDHLAPDSPGAGHWATDYFTFWNMLQALKREDDVGPGLVFVFGGVNPSALERGELLDQPNPLYETQRLYLAPMTEPDAYLMMSAIGSRMGLTLDHAAVHEVYSAVGGHPLLLRRMGSAIHESLGTRRAIQRVTVADVQRIFKKHKREFFNEVTWILQHLARVAPDEERLLRDIASGGAQSYADLWAENEFRETFAMHLERYGLVEFVNDLPEIPLSLLRDALKQPVASEFVEQKRLVKTFVDELEAAIRGRLRVDLERGETAEGTVDLIVRSIPGDAKNRPMGREQLRDLGSLSGVDALLQNLNWGDYEILLARHYEKIEWLGADMDKDTRLARIQRVVKDSHLARHNNDHDLRKLIIAEGFASFYARLTEVREMFAA